MGLRTARVSRPAVSLAAAAVAAIAGLAGCTSYHPLPLPRRPALVPTLAGLDLALPRPEGRGPATGVDIAKPLTIDQIGLLAMLNNPELKSERGEMGIARARLLEATLLPNPAADFDYGALLGGPGTANSFSLALSQQLSSLITRDARIKSAEAHVSNVDEGLLWREWQVAQQARRLALDIESGDRELALTERELRLLSREIGEVRAAVASGNLQISTLAPLLAAEAAGQQSLATLRLARLKNWQALDRLLGLVPNAAFAIARPVLGPPPADIDRLVASLPQRRPDLIALRFGYRSAEEDVRAAILGQFPAFALGGSYVSDTTAVRSAGPKLALGVPVFDRNQGHIAQARATRQLLREHYQARLDQAVANIHALAAQLGNLSADLAQARDAAAAAQSLAATARQAYAQGNLDQRALTDYQTTALRRRLETVRIEREIGEDRIQLAVDLGLGLPKTRIALAAVASR